MGWQLWHAALGPRPSSPHNSWPISSGGELTIILCVPMHHSGWRSCSLENEVANIWRNATGNALQRWQREEPTDGGQCRKCSVILCRRCHAEKCERE